MDQKQTLDVSFDSEFTQDQNEVFKRAVKKTAIKDNSQKRK
jgi:hypothetical protein